ncbi:MAG: Gfo/Idh/MocA family oxidoreductase [Planctomycetaceae bacterium]|jgi:predicted dehydrogenase|nr:Gfo/Idh/MocA family oxidoreductase [Planctomycetaceae bacterium]
MLNKTTRRDFMKTSAGVTALGFWVAAGNTVKAADSPNEKLGVAGIGVGGKGSGDIANAARWGTIVGLCDVDKGRLEGAKKQYAGSEGFTDFRELLEKLEKRIDVVIVSTPDHMHTPAALMAMRMKKHTYVQKPLTRTIYEARKLGQVAKEMGVCTQMGNQGSAQDILRQAVAQVRNGLIGAIKEVHVWSNRPVWAQGIDRTTLESYEASRKKEKEELLASDDEAKKRRGERLNVEADVAAKKGDIERDLKNLDWKLWIGAGKYRDYWPGIYHAFAWRGWWDFGSGALGDMACHTFNMPYYACELKNPTSVQAITSGHNFDSFPQRSKIFFEFPATDWRPALKVTWYDGGNRPDDALLADLKLDKTAGSGSLIVGEKGILYSNNADYCEKLDYYVDGKKVERADLPKVEFRRNTATAEGKGMDDANSYELYEAITKKDPMICYSNYTDRGGPLTETILLGNLAVWAAGKKNELGEKVEWDAVNLKVTNNVQTPGVVELIKPVYTEGYKLD